MPGVWGCPPDKTSPPRLGDYGVDSDYFSILIRLVARYNCDIICSL